MEKDKYERDRCIILQVFPVMIWNLIITKLESYSDVLANIGNCSLFLRDWLTPSRILFPKVMSILEKRRHYGLWRNLYDTSCIQAPFKIPLAKFRTVCKYWCQTSDSYLDTYKTHRCVYFVTRLTFTDETDEDSEDWFMSHFLRSHQDQEQRSPFVGNAVKIYFVEDKVLYTNPFLHFADPPEFPFQQVFQNYGKYIRFCELTLTLFHSNTYDLWYAYYLLNIMNNIPNVQTLVLNLNQYVVSTFRREVMEALESMNNWPELKQLRHLKVHGTVQKLIANILPKLPNLEYLDLCNAHSCLISLRHLAFESPDLPVVPLVSMPKLRHLGVDIFGDCASMELPRDESNNQNEMHKPFHLVFDSLRIHSGLSITSLELSFSSAEATIWKEWRRYPINFPRLKKLKIITDTWPCIDFVIQVKDSLETLVVEVTAQESFEDWWIKREDRFLFGDDRDQFPSCYANVEGSNTIWRLLSKLEILTVRERRQAWDKFGEITWRRTLGRNKN